MNFTENYSHELLSKTIYCPHSFPTEKASLQYNYELEGCGCEHKCGIENECPCIQRSGTYYTFDNINDFESYVIQEKQDMPSYECNDNCKCSGHICGNKLIQFGPRKNLIVKKCDNDLKGLGLFTCRDIEIGNFICEYAGEVTTEEEAIQRYTFYQSNDEVNFIFCIKEKFGDRLEKTFIDPTKYGNIGRYINHSCEANSKLVVIRINDQMPYLAIFAKYDLPINTEITYDYGCDVEYSKKGTTRKQCFCTSPKCRKYLPCDISIVY